MSRVLSMIKHFFTSSKLEKKVISYALGNVKELTNKVAQYLRVPPSTDKIKVGFSNVAVGITKKQVAPKEKLYHKSFPSKLIQGNVVLAGSFRQVILALCEYSTDKPFAVSV